MRVDYQPFTDRMITRYEGGYTWNAKDPGGPTKYGVTCYDLAEHRGQKMTSMKDWADNVKGMSLNEADAIFQSKYANGISFDALPAGPDCCMMDYAVNSGVSRAIRVAAALLKISTDRMSPTLLAAIQKADRVWFVNAMCTERLQFMKEIRGGAAWGEFGHGWQARVTDLNQYCISLVNKTIPTAAPNLSKVPTPKAVHQTPPAGGLVTATVMGSGVVAATANSIGLSPSATVAVSVITLAIGAIFHFMRQGDAATANAKVVLPTGA